MSSRFERPVAVRVAGRILGALLMALVWPTGVDGRVVRIVVEHREPVSVPGPAAEEGRQYERLTGRFYGELDPADPHNAIINDIRLAPRNARGKVEYWATFTLLRPADPARASGVLWYEVPNRGRSPLSPGANADSMIAGDILVSSGWQGDLAPRAGVETVSVPTARNADGSAITGPVLIRLSNLPAGASTAPLTAGYGGLHYQRPASLDTGRAVLTRQYSDDGALTPISPRDWAFASCQGRPFPGEPDPASICLKGGFEADALYQLVYTAKDPLVLSVGLAATRDLVSFLRHAERDDDGADNPAKGVRFALAEGTSQSGNFLKTFVHLGFNQDEANRIVWDGINPNIAARQTPINFRFAIPGGAADLYEPGSEGVLWWGDYRDETRGRGTGGLLDRCRATRTCPKVVETFGSAEFWGLRMSPGLVGTAASSDIPLPPEVRRYYFPGVTHGGGAGGFGAATRPAPGCTLPQNPNPSADTLRALRRALADWVVKGMPPPASRYPTVAAGELVRPERAAMGFPVIPGQPLPDNVINRFPDYDFGPLFRYADLSGEITRQPPAIRGFIPLRVPRTDADGNEVGGVASVLHSAALGTYLGWNTTAGGYRKGRGCGFAGGYIPFARTKAEREAVGDPRLSLEERYATHDGYVAKVREAARRLVQERFLLQDDADRLVRQAEASSVLR
jgi:hypothetical protein